MKRSILAAPVAALLALAAPAGSLAHAEGQVVLNEIHYLPADGSPEEFVELLNAGAAPVDLSGWSLSSAVSYAFPAGPRMDPGAYLVVARSASRLRARFGVEALGEFQGKLSSRGEKVVLKDASGRVVDEVEYRLGFPWPTVGDPPGPSIELVHPSLDNSLGASWRASGRLVRSGEGAPIDASRAGRPTPLARNTAHSLRHPPLLRRVEHRPEAPRSGEEVMLTAELSDPQGVASVAVEYQVVEPGNYIEKTDPGYAAGWAKAPLNDEGKDGDAAKGDGIYSVRLPASLQRHRRLVRYRISAAGPGGRVTAPYPEDPQPNFAWFVHDGPPPWRGAINSRSRDLQKRQVVEFGTETMRSLPVYHLIAKRDSVERATWFERDAGREYRWSGTLVYEGKVYDHIRFRPRGGCWRYAMGKNMWKFDFNRGHDFRARDDFGIPYREGWNKLNLRACIQQGDFGYRGEQGMFESVGFKLWNLAGVEAPNTHWIHLRIIDGPEEAGPSQYEGDFWGLYLAIEDIDGRFLDEHGLPDGNLYKMEGGGGRLAHRGDTGAGDGSDLNQFLSTYRRSSPPDDWWRKSLDLERYYSYRSIVECIHHYDIDEAAGKNYYYFLDPRSRRWSVHPYDIDLTWADTMYGGGESPFKRRVLRKPAFLIEYRNRLREIRDLLWNPDQVHPLIDRYAAVIHDPSRKRLMAAADRALWDHNPILDDEDRSLRFKAGRGRFYQASPTKDFPGMVKLMKDYVDSRGEWIDRTLLRDPSIPETPVLSAAVVAAGDSRGKGEGPSFHSAPFQGSAPFAAIRWRLAEVNDPRTPSSDPLAPRRFEIEAAWESGEIASPRLEVTIPAASLTAGRAYRVRARMKDATGRWSHWSKPVEFTHSL